MYLRVSICRISKSMTSVYKHLLLIIIIVIIFLRLQSLTSSAPVMVFMKGNPDVSFLEH